ncbi:MAG: GGDEF domain-containing protein [Pseudomonadota bacterium]|nr:GGDEF domain-containing protein [Pseudomonadota bacterium]
MTDPGLRVLLIGSGDGAVASMDVPDDAGFGSFEVSVGSADNVWQQLAAGPVDVLVVQGGWDGWPRCASEVAVVVVADTVDAAEWMRWLRDGAQEVVIPAEMSGAAWPRRLRAAVERQRVRAATRQAFATDVHTGLPHVGQLIEHMSYLLALREREPAPMALLVLRIEGLVTTMARLGVEASGTLRRKVAVRLRAGVRASDVVASVGDDSFAVLLSQLETPTDADRVGRKLLGSLGETFKVGGSDLAVATALGIAVYPGDGTQPDMLLRRAVGLAASAQATGRAGYANRLERGEAAAANDENPS